MKEYIKLAAVALIAGVAAGLVVGWLVNNQSGPLGGTRFPNSGLAVGTTTNPGTGDIIVEDEARLGDLQIQGIKLQLASAVRIAYWQNTTGTTVHIPIADGGFTSGTASSSFALSLFATSSAPSVIQAHDYTALVDNFDINGFLIRKVYATSTTATTTNSIMGLLDRQGNGLVDVANNGYVYLFLQRGDTACGIDPTKLKGCENASSTNRGAEGFFGEFLYFR